MRLASVAAIGDFWRVIREFNPEGIEREATAPLDIRVVGEPDSGKRTLIRSLHGTSDGVATTGPFRLVDVDYGRGPLPEIESADLVILAVRLNQDLVEAGRRAAALFARRRIPTLLVFTHADQVENTREMRNSAYRAFSFISYLKTSFLDARDRSEVQARLLPMLLETVPSLRTPLARRLPPIRPLVAEQIISETCRVNAQFALAANLPANLPFLGGVAGNVADLVVLTKNQVMLVFRLAAIYGRDISLTRRVLAEVAPVIGGAFLWRTVARMAVGMLPTLFAAVPKMAVAYVGTFVVGHAARYYYDEGRRPPRSLIQEYGAEGARLYRRFVAAGRVPDEAAV